MGDSLLLYDGLTTEDVVFACADDNMRELTWKLNGQVFAPPLEVDCYVERERHLSQQELTKDGRCTYFALTHKHDPTHIVASCQSIKKTVFIAGKDASVDGGFVEATGYAITTNVYTNPKYRRLGMAAYMLGKLQEHVDQQSECSVLYSDIGKSYYAQLGWKVFPSEQATISINHCETFQLGDDLKARFLTLEELPALCEKDVAQMKARFQTLAADHVKTHVAFAPDFAQISWQMAREDFVTDALHAKRIAHRGAITQSGSSWVYWDHDWRSKQLKILRFVLLETDHNANGAVISEEKKAWDVVELLQAAATEAAAWGLDKVLVWNPDVTTTRGIKGFHNLHEKSVDVMFDERKDLAIPSLRWKGGHVAADTVWEDNYYYAWC